MNAAEKFTVVLGGLLASAGIAIVASEALGESPMKGKHRLEVVVTHKGSFRSAKINDEELTKDDLYDILGIKSLRGYRLEKHLSDFAKVNQTWDVEWWESDVS